MWALSLHKMPVHNQCTTYMRSWAYCHIFSDTDDVATRAWAFVAFRMSLLSATGKSC